MKIGVLADTHDNVPLVRSAVRLFKRQAIDHVVHAGDFVAPFAVVPLAKLDCPVTAVLGNNDGDRLVLAQHFARFEGTLEATLATTRVGECRVAVVHYPELAESLAKSGEFDLVVYGHTHQRAERRVGATLLLNPGEAGGWLTGRSTLAIVDTASMAATFCDLEETS